MPIPVGRETDGDFARADIIVSGLEHGGASYEIRIFLGNPDAAAATPQAAWAGYAGSIHVYGYGRPPLPGPDDPGAVRIRPSRSTVATEAVRAQAGRAGAVTVTLVPIGRSEDDVIDLYGDDVSVRIEEGATPP